MLTSLSISNYVLIDKLEIHLAAGLNMITGETGAGKSIILGAMGLLIGQKADSSALLDPNKKCIIEGIFNVSRLNLMRVFQAHDLEYDAECFIRREINGKGRSRAFINDSPVTLDILKVIASQLVDIHSQHQTLVLGKQEFQLDLVDAFGDLEKQREKYRAHYHAFQVATKAWQQIVQESQKLQENHDYQKFLLDELMKLEPKEDEQKSLEQEIEKLENALEIKTALYTSQQLLEEEERSINSYLEEVLRLLQKIGRIHPNYQALYDRINTVHIELKDIVDDIANESDRVSEDPTKLTLLKERLDEIYRLQQKHRVTDTLGLIKKREALEEQVFKVENLSSHIAEIEKKMKDHEALVYETGTTLSKSRAKQFKKLAQEIQNICVTLGMPEAIIEIEREYVAPMTTGLDKINILFSANKGQPPVPLKKAASGGEFSRLMFAVKKVMAEKQVMPTLIFDEIDSGISGEIALKMGEIMEKMGNHRQLITISHLPQIASKGDAHYLVYKDNQTTKTTSKIKTLDQEGRITEIAKMLGGNPPSVAAITNAKELLGIF